MGEENQLEGRDMELLCFNYKNLHNSVWDAHKVAWTVVSIFVPILFTLQGYFIKESRALSTFQVVLGAVVTETLALIWWLIMQLLGHFNKVRMRKLRKIEDSLSRMSRNDMPFEQYSLPYTLRKDLRVGKSRISFKISPMRLYHMILIVYTLINVGIVCIWFGSA